VELNLGQGETWERVKYGEGWNLGRGETWDGVKEGVEGVENWDWLKLGAG